ncbi:MAG: excinuclease ABC subunit UvrA, partial [Steroidobacteraceae bacterium]|nr:excinuclease ABC subunit UvrA [Steroidobacteraceae bacterium]
MLAPVVGDRKGSHAEVLDNLRSQGFLRIRIDGQVVELDDLPPLDTRRKHTIEVVVDRLKLRSDAAQRLAESLETALRLSGGTARLAPGPDAEFEPLLFSQRHACPECGFSLPPLEPKMFSFNSPLGACPACDGLGYQDFFDPQRVVTQPQLSLAAGAVRGWDRRNPHYFQLLQSLARHYRFDIDQPWIELPDTARAVLLYGSGDEEIEFQYVEAAGRVVKRRHRFEGVLPNLERRYREAQSAAVREELAKYRGRRPCGTCGGTRLNRAAQHVYIRGRSLPELTALSVAQALQFCRELTLEGWRATVAKPVLREVVSRLRFLSDVGLDYLTLDRSTETLSGGEAQRIRLASQIGSGLTGVMYILDEPSIGLHQRDNQRLLATLRALRDLGNTVIVVEHDAETILAADHVVDLGPLAGLHGGRLVAQGRPADICACPQSLTGQYLAGRRQIPLPLLRVRPNPQRMLRLTGARIHNLKNLDVAIPLGLLTCVTGVSGSGKSSLVIDTLLPQVAARLSGAPPDRTALERLEGAELLDRVIAIDQTPIGRTPRSNPATYTGLFGPLRELYAAVPEARARGYDAGRFSFNVKGGRCEACQGDGVMQVEMHFLPDVYVPCDICQGRRYNRETLEIRWRGLNIAEVLDLTVEDAYNLFHAIPALHQRLQTLLDVGLSYMRLGQNATTLSGGEAQRIKLARELGKRSTGRTLYVLD